MAPLCSDPRQIVINFESPRREALLKLIDDITNYMITQLQLPEDTLGSIKTENDTPTSSTTNSGESTPKHLDDLATLPPKPMSQAEQAAKKAPKSSKESVKIQRAAMKHMLEWKKGFMPKLEEMMRVEDDAKIKAERTKRVEEMKQRSLDTPEEGEDMIDLGGVKVEKSEDFFSLQLLYHPIPTRLAGVSKQDRKETVSCILLLLLSTGKYSAHSRTLALYLASALELPQSFVIQEEVEIAKTLMESSKADEKQKEEVAMSAETETAKRKQENKFGRFWKVGLASVAGAAVIGVTGGLAAPLVAGALGGVLGGIGLGGVASFLGIFWMNGALVGALFGAYGAKMTGEMMDSYAKEVEDFKFLPLQEEWGKDYQQETPEEQQYRRLRVTVGINGWLNDEADVTKPWRVLSTETEVFALRFEMKTLLTLGTAFTELVKSAAWNTFKSEVIKRTVFATLWAALWPIQVLAAASKVDNPYSRGINRSRKAGKLLADALINKVQGERPVTLIGYSLGAGAIHACLQSLAERRAFGLVDTVVLIGTPAPADPAHWRTLRMVVSGKIFNAYSQNDMILGFVYRVYGLSLGVAGLQPIKDVEGIENLDLSEVVSGHLRYPELTGEILRKCGFVGITASKEIEKDDVILMKDEYAAEGKEGKLFDFDDEMEAQEKEKETKERDPEVKDAFKKDVADDLRGLNISPPALDPNYKPAEEETTPSPPLPRRPTQEMDTSMPARKPVPASESTKTPAKESTSNQPTKAEESTSTAPTSSSTTAPAPAPTSTEADKPKTSIADNPRPLTPTSDNSDDEKFGGITMTSNDSP